MSSPQEQRYTMFDDEEPTPDAAPPASASWLSRLESEFGDGVLATTTYHNEPTASVAPEALHEIMVWLKAQGFLLLSDLTAWDDYPRTDPRFWVIYQLTNIEAREGLRVKVGLSEKSPEVDSVVDVWPGADFLEREVYDLMGITFKNHPDLRRIMMPEEWEGHPLRRDYPPVYEEVQFTHNVDQINRRKPYATE